MHDSQRLRAYKNHIARCKFKKDAAGNPVEMLLTFEQWCQIWDSSGYWNHRGNKAGQYCMSRINDLGHYEVDNVFIQLHQENTSQFDRSRVNWPSTSGFDGKTHSLETRKFLSESNQGSKNVTAILNKDLVRKIKSLLGSLSQRQIASQFKVSQSTIAAIATGRLWSHVQ